MWNDTVQPNRSQAKLWLMCIACWVPKTTDTHSECVILIAFPLRLWLHERIPMLRYTFTVLLDSETI
jgi:hypothetical protein